MVLISGDTAISPGDRLTQTAADQPTGRPDPPRPSCLPLLGDPVALKKNPSQGIGHVRERKGQQTSFFKRVKEWLGNAISHTVTRIQFVKAPGFQFLICI